MDQNSSSNNFFDFNSQSGVRALLAAIRVSNLPPANKNELRDLVFLYTNGGGDVSVRIALEQKLNSYNIKSVAPKSAPIPVAPVLPFGSSRPAPVFTSSPASFPQPVVTSVTEPVPNANFTPQPVPTEQPSAPTPIPVTPQVQVTPVPVLTPAESPQPLPSSIPVPIPPPVVQTTPVQQSVPVSIPVDNNNYLSRIREIKSAVNSKVGNPVNLVDIDNQVGREYMNALLDAMKRLSGGAAGQDVAMQRLEDAYQAVEVAVFNHSQKPAPTAVPASIPMVENVVVNAPVEPIAESLDSNPAVLENPIIIAPKDNWPTPTPAVATSDPVLSPIKPEIAPIKFDGPSGFESQTSVPTPPIIQAPVSMEAPVVINSLANEPKKVLTLQDLPETVISAVGDPLRSREIDDGLEQLLSDWVLFKKSGLFGTGPHGREHPLYKKISELPIPLLLTGRFEGSTQEIKQSITDYMNGWRYEQGIMYEQGEKFEHYLRRVIRQILDLQKKRSPA